MKTTRLRPHALSGIDSGLSALCKNETEIYEYEEKTSRGGYERVHLLFQD
jgi:hypothetical protein